MKKSLLFLLVLGLSVVAFAQPYSYDYFTAPVSEEDGDTITTSQVSVSTSAATLILPAVTNRSNRVRAIHNTASFNVYIGTAAAGTTLSSTGYDLQPSTAGFNSVYRTRSTGSLYGLATGGSAITVTVISESNSTP